MCWGLFLAARLVRKLGILVVAIGIAAPTALAVGAAESDSAALARTARQAELDAVTRDIAVSEERKAELKKEIAALDKDRATLNTTLIDTSKRVQALEGQIGDTEKRMGALATNEDAIHASLVARRDVLAEVL